MADLRCDTCRELAPELALGLLGGDERAAVLAHLQRCERCRDDVAALTGLHERMRTLVPPVEPPAGFETCVLRRLAHAGLPQPSRSWARGLAVAAAAIVVVCATFVGGWMAGATSPATPASQSVRPELLAVPLTSGDRPVGRLFVKPATPSWIYLYVDAPAGAARLKCEFLRHDGSSAATAMLTVRSGDAHWGGPNPAGTTDVRLTDETGGFVGGARLPGD
ncbi:MAG TPA: zf-HC2 domain-containing protein [Pseudonocardia sp.]